MSNSEHDTSDASNIDSPKCFMDLDSPLSSPSHVNISNFRNSDRIAFESNRNRRNVHNGPFLRILEQPQNHFRFRYKSEMVGTHGCLLGKSPTATKTRTHPTVELMNYEGQALIRCRLAQHNNSLEHPHKLLDEDQDRDVSKLVPEDGFYRVAFPGLGIIHTAKKDVPALLYNKYAEAMRNSNFDEKALRNRCETEVKKINLNIVRLMFTAHDVQTDMEICPPVFSDCIHNMKSAATNDLKICRMSRMQGHARGGDEVYILVEKVNKKNIKIRFYELSEDGEEVWSKEASFMQNEVHHQYAIVFKTPKYQDPEITKDVRVLVELVRPSDGRTSEPRDFVYKADPVYKQIKKRKTMSSYSSLGSSSGGSIRSISDLPITVMPQTQNHVDASYVNQDMLQEFNSPKYEYPNQINTTGLLSEALLHGIMSSSPRHEEDMLLDPVLGAVSAPSMPSLPHISVNSNDFNSGMLNNGVPMGDMLMEKHLVDYMTSVYGESEASQSIGDENLRRQVFQKLLSDSGRLKDEEKYPERRIPRPVIHTRTMENLKSNGSYKKHIPVRPRLDFEKWKLSDEHKNPDEIHYQGAFEIPSNSAAALSSDRQKSHASSSESSSDVGYKPRYTTGDGSQVKQLVRELCEMIRNKKLSQKAEIKSKMERLFDIRLSNGDTFLHMALCNNVSSFEYIVKIIHSMKMTHLLNLTNEENQTILYLAVINKQLPMVSFLVSKGCNPMMEDSEGNTIIHLAVRWPECLEALLQAVQKHGVSCDLNSYNNDKETPLHIAVKENSVESVRLLLQHGADYTVRDNDGRSPLHVAAYYDHLPVLQELLKSVPSVDIDLVDQHGLTALQIVCDFPLRQNSLEVVTLLLDKQADPTKYEEGNDPAWKLARDKPTLREAMEARLPAFATGSKFSLDDDVKSEPDDDIKTEPEDDFETIDENITSDTLSERGLEKLPLYVRELSLELDKTGAWRELAARLHQDSLVNWYSKTTSPSRTMLQQIQVCDENITSRSLMMILDDIGQKKAAAIVRNSINS